MDCEKILHLNSQIIGLETHLIRTYDKFLVELLEFYFKEINRLLDKVKNVTHAHIGEHIRPSVALVSLLNSIRLNLLSISWFRISARNGRKKNLQENLKRAQKDIKKDPKLIDEPKNELDLLIANKSGP